MYCDSYTVYLSHLGQIFLVKSFKNAEELAEMGPKPVTMSDDAILAMANAAIAEYNRKWGDKEKYASGKEKWIVYPAGDD